MNRTLALAAAVVVVALSTAAPAQNLTEASFTGQWHAKSTVKETTIETTVTITGKTYIATQHMISPSVFGPTEYNATQEGDVVFNPPDNLRLVVVKWSPTETNGQPNTKPPNTNMKVLQFDGTNLVVLDNICATAAAIPDCISAYRKVP